MILKERIMRIKTIVLIVAILAIAAFAALNVDEFTRTSVLNLGFTTTEMPLGLVMLLLLVIAMVIFLASAIYMQSSHLIEARKHTRELDAQRELADKAEASRFTELRAFLEAQTNASLSRETANSAAMAERLNSTQAALLARIELSDSATAAYIGELEDRVERMNNHSAAAVRAPLL